MSGVQTYMCQLLTSAHESSLYSVRVRGRGFGLGHRTCNSPNSSRLLSDKVTVMGPPDIAVLRFTSYNVDEFQLKYAALATTFLLAPPSVAVAATKRTLLSSFLACRLNRKTVSTFKLCLCLAAALQLIVLLSHH